jgi:hypothetical protein
MKTRNLISNPKSSKNKNYNPQSLTKDDGQSANENPATDKLNSKIILVFHPFHLPSHHSAPSDAWAGRPGNWCNNCTSCKACRIDGRSSLSASMRQPTPQTGTPLLPSLRLLLLLSPLSPPPPFISSGFHHRRESLAPAFARP